MNITFKKTFLKKIKNLTKKQQLALKARLQLFQDNHLHPILNNHALHGEYNYCRSINITGDLRAIYKEDKNTITFLVLGTHSELY